MKKIFATLIVFTLMIPKVVTKGYATQPIREGIHINPQGVHISLHAGSTSILLNGEDAQLLNTPFLSNGIFYVPLREIAELLGGVVKYLPQDQSVLLAFPQTDRRNASFVRLWLSNGEIELDAGTREVATGILPKESRVVVKDGYTFIPIDFFFCFGCANSVVDGEQAILFSSGYRVGIGPFNIEDDFNALPSRIQAQFHPTGERIILDNGTGRQEVWTSGDIDLILAVGSQYWEEGSRPILFIEVKSPGVQTDWGLQVGDNEERYYNLYLLLHDFFQPEFQDGTITKLVFWSPHS